MDWLTLIGLGLVEIGLANYLGRFLVWMTNGFQNDDEE